MKKYILPIALLLVVAQSGCAPKSELEALKRNLGDFQYAGLTPSITATIQKKTLIKAESEYGSPRLLLSGVAKQEGDFPLSNYHVQIAVGVFVRDQKVGTGYLSVEMVNGNGAFSEEVMLFDAKDIILPKGSMVSVRVEAFNWSPKEDKISKLKLNDEGA
jgi:hypothetical protein